MTTKLRTAVLLEDHKLFAEVFSAFLEKTGLFSRVLICSGEKDVLQLLINEIKPSQPVCFFMDYYVPDCNVLHLMGDIRRLHPRSFIIIVSSVLNAGVIAKIMMHKPNGFISKAAGLSEVVECLHAAGTAEPYLSPDIRQILDARSGDPAQVEFTSKEMQILALIARGNSILKIAEALHLSRHTVIAHRRNMLRKTACHSVTEMLAWAFDMGLVFND